MANEINIKSEPNSNIEVTDISTIATDITEGTIIKVTADETYNSNKQYTHYNSSNNRIVIQDTDHFNCIKNGYYSIANGINHYYTKSGDNYNYNAVPSNVNTWVGKWSFSNTIKDKTLYSISPESDRICVNGIYSISSEADRICIGNTYYKKSGNNYIEQDVTTYNTYDDSIYVSWNNEYLGETTLDETTFKNITVWKTKSGTIATSGYYLSIDEKSNGTYIVQLLNLTFDAKGVYSGDIIFDGLYKLPSDFNFQDSVIYYLKNGNNFEGLKVNQGQCTFTTFPTTDHSFYIYQKGADWSYPNTTGPEYSILTGTDGIYDSNSFPLYTNATIAGITKTWHKSYTIYEKTAVKINYNYSGDANSLKFIFTDKNIDGVLEACNLPDSVKKYVHLTNLKYNEN